MKSVAVCAVKGGVGKTKTILEVACGTWEVAKELISRKYKVTGLDISEKMLKKAEENIDKKNLLLADMTDFNLDKTFDAVLCNYNSICHLLKWEQWQAFFKMTSNHLEKDWLFVFDINTVRSLTVNNKEKHLEPSLIISKIHLFLS